MNPTDPYARHRNPLPQFLVISPPKTGSTWLAENLRRHPQLFLPAIKEVRYFNLLFKRLDLDWYNSHFAEATGRLAGEATPSYAALPVECIRWIRELAPGLKLIFLMRDPLSRAWSHAKHMHRFREGDFEDCTATIEDVSTERWAQHIAGDWPLLMGDYLGQLRRWLTVFPKEQVFVGFYESIGDDPESLLRRILEFLDVDSTIDLAPFPMRDRVLGGPKGDPGSELECRLQRLFRSRTEELSGFLRTTLGLACPAAWQRSVAGDQQTPWPLKDRDDLAILQIGSLEERFRTAYREICLEYCGHDLVFYRGRLLGIPHFLGPRDLPALQQMPIDRHIAERTILTAPGIEDLKDAVLSRAKERLEARFDVLEGDVRRFREETMKVHRALELVTAEVNRLAQMPVWAQKIKWFRRLLIRSSSRVG